MKRILRFRFLVLLISLAVAGLIVFLWIETDHQTWLVHWTRRDRNYVVRADAWRLCFERLQFDGVAVPRQGGWNVTFPPGQPAPFEGIGLIPTKLALGNGYGFGYWDYPRTPRQPEYGLCRLTVPFWPLLLLSLLPTVLVLRRVALDRRYRQRLASGKCPNCGYDLRATPERCPECGTVSTKVKEATN